MNISELRTAVEEYDDLQDRLDTLQTCLHELEGADNISGEVCYLAFRAADCRDTLFQLHASGIRISKFVRYLKLEISGKMTILKVAQDNILSEVSSG